MQHTAIIVTVQRLEGDMTFTFPIMRVAIIILTSIATRTPVPTVTITSGLEAAMETVSVQMS